VLNVTFIFTARRMQRTLARY